MKHISNIWSELDLYNTYSTTDAMMGIENKSHTRNFPTEASKSPLSIANISSNFLGFLNFQFLFTTTSWVEIFPALSLFSRLIMVMTAQLFK